MNEEKKKRVPICPDSTGFTPAFMRRMIAYFEDVDEAEIEVIGNAGMWPTLGTHYKHLIPKFEKFFLDAEEGDPLHALYHMYLYCGTSLYTLIRAVETACAGEPSCVAAWLVLSKQAEVDWAKGIIEHNTTREGTPHAAVALYKDNLVDLEWVKGIIERCNNWGSYGAAHYLWTAGDVPYIFVEQFKSKWEEKFIRKADKE
jgi:hypothetical protein